MTDEQTQEVMAQEQPIEDVVRQDKDDQEVEVQVETLSETETSEAEATEQEFDELADLRQQLNEAQAQADEYLDDLRRERAAFQNYKKRRQNERAAMWQTAQAELLIQILPILDDMERALDSAPGDSDAERPAEEKSVDRSWHSWLDGILLIQRKLQTTLENAGVLVVEADPGQPFDPLFHEAVSYEDNDEFEEGEIIAVVQKGHRLGERVLRPAMVRVAK